MKLGELLNDSTVVEADMDVTGLALDSREVEGGDAFIALAGSQYHGLKFASQAVRKGAVAVIYEKAAESADWLKGLKGANLIGVEDLGRVVGEIAARFYGYPSKQLSVLGITGTNGKTSCSQFLAQALDDCGVIGTLGWGDPDHLHECINTTPDALSNQKMLSEFVNQRKKAAAIEVSSHGLDQGRVNGIEFTGAVVTNISRDHLDYHPSMEAYVQAKLKLMNKPGLKFAVVNLDDDYFQRFIDAIPRGVVVWGFSKSGRGSEKVEVITAADVKHTAEGTEFEVHWNSQRNVIKTPLFGEFNVENVLAVYTVLIAMKVPAKEAAEKMSRLRPVPGRMERYVSEGDSPVVFVDYAHTPDALNQVISGLRKHCRNKLWVIFGCGGERDKGKRSEMGRIAVNLADKVVITNDNPRGEDPKQIIEDILSGCSSTVAIEINQDRNAAIRSVIQRASKGDMVLVAGKGHEDYQEINGNKIPFSDAAVVSEALQLRRR